MVITIEVANCTMMKTLVDQGSPINVLFLKTFKRMGISWDKVIPYDEQIVRFLGEKVYTKGYVDLHTKFGENEKQKTIKIWYQIVDAKTLYNALLGRPPLNRPGAIVSTLHLTIKFPVEDGWCVARVKTHHKIAIECYVTSMRILSRYTRLKRDVNSIAAKGDFYSRPNDESCVKPKDEIVHLLLGKSRQNTRINTSLGEADKQRIMEVLTTNKDLFAWATSDMPGIDPRIMSHRLSVYRHKIGCTKKEKNGGGGKVGGRGRS